MKTTTFLMVAVMVMAPFFLNAQGAVGIATSNPRSTLEINGTLRVDSTKPINNPKRIAVLSDSNTVDYVSLDSLMKLFSKLDSSDLCDLGGRSIRELYFSTQFIYSDRCEYLVGSTSISSSSRLMTFDNINYLRYRDTDIDWSAASACYARMKIGSNIFTLLFNSAGTEQRIYRYDYNSFSTGILVPITVQIVPSPLFNFFRVFYDGTYFLFDSKAGNSSNQLIVSRYTFNGSAMLYVDDIIFAVPPVLGSNFSTLQKGGNGFYYMLIPINSAEISISKYNPDGSYTGKEKRIYAMGFNSVNMISIGGTIYLYYNSSGNSPVFRKMNLF